MNRHEKLHAARKRIELLAVTTEAAVAVGPHAPGWLARVIIDAFNAGYEAAEPDVCARCGAEIAREAKR